MSSAAAAPPFPAIYEGQDSSKPPPIPPKEDAPIETEEQLRERLAGLVKKRKSLEAEIYEKRRRHNSSKPKIKPKTNFDDLLPEQQAILLAATNRLAGITLEHYPTDPSCLAFRLDVRSTASYRLILQLQSSTTTMDGAKYFKVVVREQQLVPAIPDATEIVERHMEQAVVKANKMLKALRNIVQEVYFKCHCYHVRQDCVEYLESLAALDATTASATKEDTSDVQRAFQIDAVEVDSSRGKNCRVEFTILHSLSRVGKLDVILEWSAEGTEHPEAIITVPVSDEDSSRTVALLNLKDAAKSAFRNNPIEQALQKVSNAMADN